MKGKAMANPIPYTVVEMKERSMAPLGAIPVNLFGAGSGGEASGPQGEPGPEGPPGIQGPQGIPGPAGRDGVDGADGAEGPAGLPGTEGPQGIQGPRGERGADGTSIVIDGYVQDAADLPDLTGDPAGPSYIVMSTGHIHFWNGTDFTDGGNVTGPAGADGEPGAQGPAGSQGLQGIRGVQGERGIAGADGPEGPQGIQGVPGPAGVGIPEGGVEGQILVKSASSTTWGRDRVTFAGVTSKAANSTVDVGSFRVRFSVADDNSVYLSLFSIAGSKVVTSGAASSVVGSASMSARTFRRQTVTTTTSIAIVGNAQYATFVFRDISTGETWRGEVNSPYVGAGSAAADVVAVFDRVS